MVQEQQVAPWVAIIVTEIYIVVVVMVMMIPYMRISGLLCLNL